MKSNWEVKKLGEVCDKASSNVSQNQLGNESGKYPIFGASGLIKNVSFFHQNNAYISIVKDGAGIGRITLQPAYSSIIGTLQYLIPKKEIDISYLYYFLSGIDFNKHRNGATIPHIYFRDYSEEKIGVPPLATQKLIVSILDKSFEKIAKAKENAERNLKNAKELFESHLQSVFENKGKDWEEKTLGEVCQFVRGPFGGSLKKSIFKPNGFAVYEQQHAIYNQFEDIRYFIDEGKFYEMKRFELKPGDLIMSCSGTMGKTAIVPKIIKEGIINQALLKLTPSKSISVLFLRLWMQSVDFQKKLTSKGAAIKNVSSVKILKEIKIPLPSIKEQQSLVSKLDALSAETKKLEAIYQQKLNDLEELKKSLLQKAFNGELIKE